LIRRPRAQHFFVESGGAHQFRCLLDAARHDLSRRSRTHRQSRTLVGSVHRIDVIVEEALTESTLLDSITLLPFHHQSGM